MTHYNAGRPFILAGHSQGAKAVIELLKHTITPRQHDNMIAAYAFGFSVCDQELEQYPMLRPARDSVDCGVLICYNSVSAPEAVSPLFRDNVICINPLNWHTDTTYAHGRAAYRCGIFRCRRPGRYLESPYRGAH